MGRSAALLTAARLSTAVALFLLTVAAARLLDPGALGAASVGQTIGTVAALLANGGINISTIYFLRRRPGERAALIGRLSFLAGASSLTAILLTLASAPLVFGLILRAGDWPLLLSAAMMGAALVGFEFAGALLLGTDRPRTFTLLEVLRGWASLVAVLAIIFVVRDGFGLVLGFAIGFTAGAVLGLVAVARRDSILPRYDRRVAGEALGMGLRGQVGNVLQFFGVRLDLLLVPAFLGLGDAGVYFVAVRISDLVGQAATATSSLVFPHVAGQRDRTSFEATVRITRMTLLVTGAAAVVIGTFAEPVLSLVFGVAYAAGAPSLLVLLAATLPLSLGRLLAADLKGRGHPGLVSAAAAVAVAVTVALDIALIPAWGIIGAAIASVVAYSLSTAVLLLAFRAVTGGRVSSFIPGRGDIRMLRSVVVGFVSRAV